MSAPMKGNVTAYEQYAVNALDTAHTQGEGEWRDYYAARAQVYATLALAAATCEQTERFAPVRLVTGE